MPSPAVAIKRTNAGRKFSDDERKDVLERVNRMDLCGYSQSEIAEEIGVSKEMVRLYLEKIQNDRRHRPAKNLDELRKERLEQYRYIRKVAWDEYIRSQSNAEMTEEQQQLVDEYKQVDGKIQRVGQKMSVVKLIKKSRGRLGGAEYLKIIADQLEKESELEGLIDRGPGEGTTVNLNWNTPDMMVRPVVEDPLEVKIKELAPPAPKPEIADSEQVMDAMFEPKTNGDLH